MKLRQSKIKELSEITGINIHKKSNVEEDKNYIYVDKKIYFIKKEGLLIPTIKIVRENDLWPCVTVDEGAVKFMVKGADLMRPGITNFDEFKNNSVVVIKDEKNKSPLAVGISLIDSEKIKNSVTGKVILNVHHVGDDVWKQILSSPQ